MKKIKVFSCPWHIGHQAELLKLNKHGVEFTYLENNVRHWGESARPMPEHLKWTAYYEKGKYDLAILHIDQQCTDPRLGKAQLFNSLNEIITDIPKIIINHGTPMWAERYGEDIVINGGIIYQDGNEVQIEGMKKQIGDSYMVVNSNDAVKRWGWGYPIIHGLSPDEWFDLPKEPRAVNMTSPAGLDTYYNRQLLTAIKEVMKDDYGLPFIQITNEYMPDNFDDYRDFLGRSLIYVHQAKDAPMSRARTEAMLSGCCILTTDNHNASDFIVTGQNGFLIPENPAVIAKLCATLIKDNYKQAIEIGQAGKKTALKNFQSDRYLNDWMELIDLVLSNKIKGGQECLRKSPQKLEP